jgi:AraC-like DNA-binding protein
MKVVSLRVSDVDEIQELVTRPLGDVDPWEIQYCQTERGAFDGAYEGAALPRQLNALDEVSGAVDDVAAAQGNPLLRDPAVYTSRHRYERRLNIVGRAPLKLVAFIVPLTRDTTIRQKGQPVGPDQLLALGAGEELDAFTPSGSDFLSVRLDPDYVEGLACALGREERQISSGVLTPDAQALRVLKQDMLQCFTPTDEGLDEPKSAVERLTSRIEESLIAALDNSRARPRAIGVLRRQAIVRLAREYMHANTDRPISTRELCLVTGVSARTLQYVFRWYFGVSPKAYHVRLRLKHVRRELLRRNPTPESVSQVALSWGFTHLGRFAGEYRAMFAELPSATREGRR